MEAGTDGADRTPQDTGYIFVAPLFQIAQEDDIAVAFGQFPQRAMERRGGFIADQFAEDVGIEGTINRFGNWSLTTDDADQITGNAVKKTFERAFGFVESRSWPHELY